MENKQSVISYYFKELIGENLASEINKNVYHNFYIEVRKNTISELGRNINWQYNGLDIWG